VGLLWQALHNPHYTSANVKPATLRAEYKKFYVFIPLDIRCVMLEAQEGHEAACQQLRYKISNIGRNEIKREHSLPSLSTNSCLHASRAAESSRYFGEVI